MLQTRTIINNERSPRGSQVPTAVTVELLTATHQPEVLAFLSQRPIHTVAMKSFVRDNGLESPLNRGDFYGCRDINGHLEGVALVGHSTLIETLSDRALEALALVARECPYTHMIMGEQERVADFWSNYADAGIRPRLACREWLLELHAPDTTTKAVPGLRLATEEELEMVMPIQAQLAFEESGVDPLKVDPEGFLKRCLRRIQQGRTWVLFKADALIFKADVISETDEVVYLEGVWVRDGNRSNGYGARCIAELSRRLLTRTKSICLLANELNIGALTFYRKCGFRFRSTYETIFLSKKGTLTH
ncbi:MAG TPA: GNAT family N-acetyltransferase [Pyrinomonadaceae bacterium]|jgi:GNAT superfamily N-acetyltransferase|nr:GNAT family N-acetyltransferase [Pyrinomonadaceae bacterium]